MQVCARRLWDIAPIQRSLLRILDSAASTRHRLYSEGNILEGRKWGALVLRHPQTLMREYSGVRWQAKLSRKGAEGRSRSHSGTTEECAHIGDLDAGGGGLLESTLAIVDNVSHYPSRSDA
jgi:hypothetical protein